MIRRNKRPKAKVQRTQPRSVRVKRTLRPRKTSNRIFPMGGYMPNPPDDCELPDKIVEHSDGGVWIDIVICRSICPKMCEKALALRASRTAHIDYHKEIKE